MLNFSLRQRTPLILQTEAAECGQACVAMVAGYHGHRIDLATLRARHSVSLKGSTLAELMHLAAALGLAARPLRLELTHLPQLKLPCILHWDFNHFVVLERVGAGTVTLLDPSAGRREVAVDALSRHFTGVALELEPTHAFVRADARRSMSLPALVGTLPRLGGAAGQVLALALMLQVFALLAPFFLQWVVDEAIVSRDRDLVGVLGVGFLLLVGLQVAMTALRGWVLMVLGTNLNLQLMHNLFRHLIRLPMVWFDKRHIGDVVSRFDSLSTIQRTLTTSLLEALIDGVMALGTAAMMWLYSPVLAGVAMVAAALYALLRFALYRPLRTATEEQIVRGAKQHSHFLETVRGMQGIKLFAREDLRTTAWRHLVVDQFNAAIRTQRMNLLFQGGNGLLFGVENVITIWIGARLVLDTAAGGSAFTVGMLFAFVAYKAQFVQRVSALIEKGLELRMLKLHAERVADIALEPTEPMDAASPIGAQRLRGSIELENVSFRYADADPMLIDNVSLRIEAGESIAIIGPSGGGKTTLIKLMLGLLQPVAGTIKVDGVPLARLGLAQYRNAVASVMQEDQLFAGSIAENIAFFDPQPEWTRIEACARLAEVHDDIVSMPMQYNTLVGDMGTVFSGGQKQRILLARALYRMPRILFLDEATSHLDLVRERCINDAVRRLRLTRVIVAHRKETIASADRVVKLAGGRIVNEMAVTRPIAAGEAGEAGARGALVAAKAS